MNELNGKRQDQQFTAELLADYAELGAIKIAKGFVKFDMWSREMLRDYDHYPEIEKHLVLIWMKADRIYEERLKTDDSRSSEKLPVTDTAAMPTPEPLGYARIDLERTFDSTYWLSRAKRANGLPEGSSLPEAKGKALMEILAEGTAAETKARKAVSDGPTPAERAKAEREAKAELGPEPNPPVGARRHQDRRTVDEEGNRIPTLEERQAHYKERLLAKIDEKLAGVVKERNASKWALSLAEQEVVALDPAVRQARTKLARFMAEQHKLSWWALMWASQSGHKGWFMQLWEQDRLRSIILLAGATVFALAALRPSWNAHRVLRSRNVYDSPAGRAWLWDGPRPTTIEEWNAFSGQPNWAARVQAIGYHVDFGRTILELSAVAVVTVALVLLLKRQARNP